MGICDIVPAKNHFVAKPIEEDEETTVYGFVLPKNFHQKPMKADVVAVSDEPFDSSLAVSVGDVVILPKYGATKVRDVAATYHLCHIGDVIGIV